ncbi:hypothetical protein RJT34_25670 [Clitoria ternatea]|uniref:PGG domain-containing protein n=1 Tax=Clitoria ternatea TaxID=43366 RepID=A0AAN9FWM1_CLITE
MLHVVDNHGNNVLHLVGKLGAEARFAAPIHHVLIRSEEQWFKDVEKVVPAAFRTMKNNDGLTPNELFYVEHKDHSEKALSAMNEMANNFLVVGTLIVTLGITAALTIRTNNVTGPTPMFKENTWYIIFTLSVAFGVSLCVLSMIFFTSVLATWKLSSHGFISSRLARMWTGCLLLYASVGVLGVFALISGVVLVFTFFPRWVFIVIAALIGIPFILSFLIYKNSFFMSVRLMLVLSGEVGNIMGIKWTPFTFGYDVM